MCYISVSITQQGGRHERIQLETDPGIRGRGGIGELFTQAPQALFLSQSTVSAHLAALETALSTRLLDRDARRRVRLTPEGERVYPAAKKILADCAALEEVLQNQDGAGLPLLLGASHGTGAVSAAGAAGSVYGSRLRASATICAGATRPRSTSCSTAAPCGWASWELCWSRIP